LSCNFLKISFRHIDASYWQVIVGEKIEFSEPPNIVKKYLIILQTTVADHMTSSKRVNILMQFNRKFCLQVNAFLRGQMLMFLLNTVEVLRKFRNWSTPRKLKNLDWDFWLLDFRFLINVIRTYVLWDVSLSTNVESRQHFTCTALMLSNNVFVHVGCGKIQFWFALGNVLLKPVLFVCANGFYVLLEQSLHELFLNVAINVNATKKHLPLIFAWFVSFHETVLH